MKSFLTIVFISLLSATLVLQAQETKSGDQKKAGSFDWPMVQHSETRPWTWWWWHGSAADTANIARIIQSFHKAGLGGVNMVFPLSVKDEQAPKVNFLSPEWSHLVTFAVKTSRNLGMDADIAPVSGWAFGGPTITKENACAVVKMRRFPSDYILAKKNIFASAPEDDFNFGNLESVLACSKDGQRILITDKTKPDGTIDWQIPPGEWTFYVTCNHPGSSKVRFPSPDQSGFVVDHLKDKAMKEYLSQFDRAFAGVSKEELPRAYNVDSWEINLDWTKGFFDEFLKRRGYDLQLYMPELFRYSTDELASRVICDYRETLSDLLIDNFTRTFHDWTHKLGGKDIGEVLSEPSNILDANAIFDIPQLDLGGRLETFSKEGKYITDQFDEKCAASAAHIFGKSYIASETFTCMGPIFNTPLEQCKEKVDYDFVSGVNHTCFHGITYSPSSARWPGWLFYAGTHLGDFNPLWQLSGSQLCTYITRVQSFLQLGRQDNDLLFYLPYYDIFSRLDAEQGQAPRWWTNYLNKANFPTATKLIEAGSDFDFVSDKMLQEVISVENAMIVSKGNRYKAIVVADCQRMPISTLNRIIELAKKGATVLFIGELPSDIPGMYQLAERQKQFSLMMKELRSDLLTVDSGISIQKTGSGVIVYGDRVRNTFQYAGIYREVMSDDGLQFTRRRDSDGWIYFIANPGSNKVIAKWVPLSVNGNCAVIFDPMSGQKGLASYRRTAQDKSEVYLQLEPRESLILKVYDKIIQGGKWHYKALIGSPLLITGKWNVNFMSGGEIIPRKEEITELTSWTTWRSPQSSVLKGFSGIAKYSITFRKPAGEADDYLLSLGEVCHSAKVFLNGKLLGNLISRPKQVLCGDALIEGNNLLEVEVANSPINRIAYLDIHGINWYHETLWMNLSSCDWEYEKKDLSWISEVSGLLGPVKLIPIKYMKINSK